MYPKPRYTNSNALLILTHLNSKGTCKKFFDENYTGEGLSMELKTVSLRVCHVMRVLAC